MTPPPDISILMIAFNQDAYIGEAIASVLAQETAQTWELVIGDDCSTDGTLAVALEWGERYPERIRVLRRESNLGFIRNFLDVLDHCRGRYIAILEGDDFWIDSGKLEFQFQFMESHPEVSLCGGAVRTLEMGPDGTRLWLEPGRRRPGLFTTARLLESNPVHTPTAFFRADRLPRLPAEFYDLGLLDWATWILLSLTGPVAVAARELAAYRRHSGGIWSLRPERHRLEATLGMFALLPGILPAELHSAAERTRHRLMGALGVNLIRGGARAAGWALLRPGLRHPSLWGPTAVLVLSLFLEPWVRGLRARLAG